MPRELRKPQAGSAAWTSLSPGWLHRRVDSGRGSEGAVAENWYLTVGLTSGKRRNCTRNVRILYRELRCQQQLMIGRKHRMLMN